MPSGRNLPTVRPVTPLPTYMLLSRPSRARWLDRPAGSRPQSWRRRKTIRKPGLCFCSSSRSRFATSPTNLLRRGLEQGQFRSDLDIPRLLDAAVGAIYMRLLLGQSLDPAWARDLTDLLLKGCLPAKRL